MERKLNGFIQKEKDKLKMKKMCDSEKVCMQEVMIYKAGKT